jgi:hypothetical protein
MTIEFPDDLAQPLHERSRDRLEDARRLYIEDQNERTRADYLGVLTKFADLVLRGECPED